MSLWKTQPDLDQLNQFIASCAPGQLGIELLEVGPDFLKGRMPVDHRTRQPMGALHGGASILFAETLGSFAAYLAIDTAHAVCVGQEINGNHLRSVQQGWVYGVARPHHIGGRSHVWGIEITDEQSKLVCIARLTMAVLSASE